MKSVEERAKYDEYEMKDEYDFSDGVNTLAKNSQ